MNEPDAAGVVAGDEGEVDGLPVLADEPTVVRQNIVRAHPPGGGALGQPRPARVVIPAVQAAAVAAGGFVAGAAVVGLVQRRQRRASALSKGQRAGRELAGGRRGARAAGRTVDLVQIVSSRSLLVDVHLLGGRED